MNVSQLRLNESLIFDDYVQSVELASFGSDYTGATCVEAGWSQLGGHMKLQFANTTVLSDQVCADNDNTGPMGYGTMCAGEGDTGTAVMCPGYTGTGCSMTNSIRCWG